MTAGRRKPGKGRFPSKGGTEDEVFDASPDRNSAPIIADGAKDLRDTEAWKKGKSSVTGAWDRYLKILKDSFQNMDRYDQEVLITRFCYVISIGISGIILSCFYGLLPAMVRVLALPIVLAGGWYVGSKIVAPAMIARIIK
ncbi:MAG: hypothetical protein HY986_03110 [Candidatus Melainabacteria bacterium]|nr:hypothetical protein [Candidatus Melainabacteria bacterium]